MNINLFFQISKQFFDEMYSQGFDETENSIECDEWFERTNEELCMCNLCLIIKQMLSIIELKKSIKRE